MPARGEWGAVYTRSVTRKERGEQPASPVEPTAGRGAHDTPPDDREAADPTAQKGVVTAAHGPDSAAELHGPVRAPVGVAVAGEAAAHRASDEGHEDAHADEHDDAHAEPRLGPIDLPAWALSIVGAALGLLVAGLFYLAIT